METTIRINTDLLTSDILEGIKKMFPHKTVDILIQPSDDTEYIMGNPAYERELKERIEEYKKGQNTTTVNLAELL